jgi:hypothetical protein
MIMQLTDFKELNDFINDLNYRLDDIRSSVSDKEILSSLEMIKNSATDIIWRVSDIQRKEAHANGNKCNVANCFNCKDLEVV